MLRGRTSRTLTDGRGFIFDDVYGDFAQNAAAMRNVAADAVLAEIARMTSCTASLPARSRI